MKSRWQFVLIIFGAFFLLAFAIRWQKDSRATSDGPGLPNRSYPPQDVMRVIATIDASNSAPRAHGTASMHKGYLVIIYSDDGEANGGFSFYDFSVPNTPVLVSRKDDAETHDIREAHGYGYSYSSSSGRDLVALQAALGIQIWDWTDVRNPERLSYLQLPGIEDSNYALGAWWLCWQAPFIYVGGSGNGIYIVDATDPRKPMLVHRGPGKPNPIPIAQTGGFRIGPIFAVGNVLAASSMEEGGYVTMDISDPVNPVLLAAQTHNMPPVYSSLLNGNKILGVDIYNNFTVFDISDPTRIVYENGMSLAGRGGYVTFQDGFAHAGASEHYMKIDMRDRTHYESAGRASSGIAERDEDFAVVMGNLVLVSDDHGNGSFIVPHQAEPDRNPPAVNMISPKNGALHQAVTSRIGMTFTDQIDLRSVNESSFIVRPVGGGAALAGKYSSQTGIVNFAPNAPLASNTAYEVVLPAGGIRDLAGNALATTFRSVFSTGASLQPPMRCEILPLAPALVGANAVFAATTQNVSGVVRYSWDFGDGSPATPFSTNADAAHVYTQPGHYIVQVTAKDNVATTRASSVQTIHHLVTSTAPTASSTILLDEARQLVWNVNTDNASVTASDALLFNKKFETRVGKEPRTLAQAPDGSMWVVNEGDASISILNGEHGAHLRTLALPYASRPYGIAFSPQGDAAYVTLQATGRLLKIAPNTHHIIGDIAVGVTPRGIAITHDAQRIFITRFISSQTHGEVVEVNAMTFAVARTFNLAMDSGPDTESSGRGVPNYLSSVRLTPDGRRAWLPSKKDNVQRGLRRDGLPLTFESTVRTIVSQIDLTNNVEDLSARRDLNDRDMASAVAFSALGDYAFIAVQGSNTIDVLDAYSRALITSIENVGLAPQGLAMSRDGAKLFVQNFMSRSVAVYDVSAITANGTKHAHKLAEIATVSQEALAPLVLQGKQIFYNANDRRMNRDGYLSCASCHLEGEQDGRVWDFSDRGEGWRNTISLRGRRGTAQGRLHWSANFDEVQDFEHDIRNAFGGSGFMHDGDFNSGTRNQPLGERKASVSAELDALAAYVESLAATPASPYRNTNGMLTSAARLGRFIFQRQKCASCHGGNEFTDSFSNVRHDVGTIKPTSGNRLGGPLRALDTPSLRGVWSTAPYLHDGSAATLLDVLTTASAQHGNLTQLNAQERQQLAAYLAQIDDLEPAIATQPLPHEIAAPLTLSHSASAQKVSLRVDNTAFEDDIAAVAFYLNENKIAQASAPPFEVAWNETARDLREVTARVQHRNGAVSFIAPSVLSANPMNERIVLRDSLVNGTKGQRTGGMFVGGGWQVTGANDMLVYDLGTYLKRGSLEFELRNFQPSRQNALQRHHFMSMYRNPWGNHHPAENLETVWNLHSGFYYNPGVKLLSWTYDENEQNTINKNDWSLAQTYQIKVEWSGRQVSYYRNGELQATHTHSDEMQLRYLFVGRDFTVSGDLLTNYQHNQYPAMSGPIFSNLVIKTPAALSDVSPPFIVNSTISEVFANGVRLRWSTNESATSFVEFGLTTNYGQRTPVLGVPAQDFTTAIASLLPSQVYHYRIVVSDSAGNVSTSSDQTFTTKRSGAYIFKPSADTFVERAGLIGSKRDNANFGWMSLIASAGRECYLRFDANDLRGTITSAKLRLHGRQTGEGGAVRALHESWKELSTTWLNKPVVNGKTLGRIARVEAGQWHEVVADSVVTRSGSYDFAFWGEGEELVAFDARESTNHQPELIVRTIEKPLALYEVYEIALHASNIGVNPYLNGPEVTVTFTGFSGKAAGKSIAVKGFWDGDSTYRVRFAPTAMGGWIWSSTSNNVGLNNKSGGFTCEGILPEQHVSWHGHVHESQAFPYTFAHDDGTPFFLLGDTQWSFGNSAITWPEEFQAYINARAAQGFNYVHGVVYQTFPTGRSQNEGGEAFLNNDVNQLDPGFWRALDRRIAYMNENGIVAGMMLAWANNAWRNFSTTAQVERFVQYLVNRYAAYNVFWITAGEYEEMSPPGGHTYVGELLFARDPYRHPITTHTVKTSADDFGNATWHTTIYQQTDDIALVSQDRIYNKPVINSEFGYEGDQSSEEVRRDAWEIVMRGGFLVYGDTTTFHYNAVMSPNNLYSKGASYMTVLKNFWRKSGIRWWQLSQFRALGNRRWMAYQPGVESVVYVESAGNFTVDLSHMNGEIRGRWFDTINGQWGSVISGVASNAFILSPPGEGYVAYLSSPNDAAALEISNVLITNVTSRSAEVTWSTNEVADSQIEYGLSGQFDLKTTLDSSQTLSHRMALSGLKSNSRYSLRVLSRDVNGNLATGQNMTFRTDGLKGRNVASLALATASSENTMAGQTAEKAIDGVATGFPVNPVYEWATLSEVKDVWLRLNFPEPITVSGITLYDRPNLSDHILNAELHLSDGTIQKIPALPNDGRPLTVVFSDRVISWLRFVVTEAKGERLGLAEIEVWSDGDIDSSQSDNNGSTPQMFGLSPAYPNPFNKEMRMLLNLPESGKCRVRVLSVQGQEVLSLVDEFVSAGRHGIVWYGKNQYGAEVSSGLYFIQVEFGVSTGAKQYDFQKVLLLK